jgi:hypothetical protein
MTAGLYAEDVYIILAVIMALRVAHTSARIFACPVFAPLLWRTAKRSAFSV